MSQQDTSTPDTSNQRVTRKRTRAASAASAAAAAALSPPTTTSQTVSRPISQGMRMRAGWLSQSHRLKIITHFLFQLGKFVPTSLTQNVFSSDDDFVLWEREPNRTIAHSLGGF